MKSARPALLPLLLGLLSGCATPGTFPKYPASTVFGAAQAGDAAQLKALLAGRDEPNVEAVLNSCRLGQKVTALMVAAAEGHSEAVRLLLAAGADPNRQVPKTLQWECNNFTALIFAAKGGHAEAVKLLLAAGADTGVRGGPWGGRAAVEWARKTKHPDIADLIASAETMSLEERKTKFGAPLTPAP